MRFADIPTLPAEGLPAHGPPIQRAPLRGFRHWLGRTTNIAIGAAGRRGRDGGPVNPPAPQAPPPQPVRQFTNEQLDEHVKAYRKARYYHSTRDTTADLIMQQGMIASRGGGLDAQEQRQHRDLNFLGADYETAREYRGYYGANGETLRPFLTAQQHNSDHLVEDWNGGTLAAATIPEDIPANHIMRGRFAEQNPQTLQSIFDVVRQHYPNPNGIATDEVIARHREAIQTGHTTHRYGQRNYVYPEDIGTRQVAERYGQIDDGYISD